VGIVLSVVFWRSTMPAFVAMLATTTVVELCARSRRAALKTWRVRAKLAALVAYFAAAILWGRLDFAGLTFIVTLLWLGFAVLGWLTVVAIMEIVRRIYWLVLKARALPSIFGRKRG
jgi:hypothetical protein